MVDNLRLVNVVGGGNLGLEIDLFELHNNIDITTTYEPESYPGLHFKTPKTDVTVMVFSSGEYHLTGGNSINDLHNTKQNLIEILESIGVELEEGLVTFEVRNLVYTANIESELDLSALSIYLGLDVVEYEPEQSPALFYSSPEFEGTFFIFRTGKLILAGCKNKEDCIKAFDFLGNQLNEIFTNKNNKE